MKSLGPQKKIKNEKKKEKREEKGASKVV